jgi:hypothetical protein
MEGISPEEEFLMKTFPQAEIGVMVLQSTVNFWGYALLAAGQKIRVRAGSYGRWHICGRGSATFTGDGFVGKIYAGQGWPTHLHVG